MENQKRFVEKRKNSRISVSIPIKYRILTENNRKPITEWMEGITENVSIDGLGFKTDCDDKQIELLTNECIVVAVDFHLPQTEQYLRYEARLIYFNESMDTKDKQKKNILLGLSFTNMDEIGKNVISEFMRKKI